MLQFCVQWKDYKNNSNLGAWKLFLSLGIFFSYYLSLEDSISLLFSLRVFTAIFMFASTDSQFFHCSFAALGSSYVFPRSSTHKSLRCSPISFAQTTYFFFVCISSFLVLRIFNLYYFTVVLCSRPAPWLSYPSNLLAFFPLAFLGCYHSAL